MRIPIYSALSKLIAFFGSTQCSGLETPGPLNLRGSRERTLQG